MININLTDIENSAYGMVELEKAIKKVEGRCRTRTLSAKDILIQIKLVEDCLKLSEEELVGTKIISDVNACHYKYNYRKHHWSLPNSTIFYAERQESGWVVTDIIRYTNWNSFYTVKVQLKEDDGYYRHF